MKLRNSCFLLFAFVCFSCYIDQNGKEPIPVINIDDVKNEEFPFDKYTVAPIFLEESEESFVASVNKVVVRKDRIYIVETFRDGNFEVFIFDIKGNFINQISAGEPGTEGYFKRVFDFLVKDDIIEILDVNQRKILSFNEGGELLSKKDIDIQAKTFARVNDRYIFHISQRSEAEAVYATYTEDLTEESFHIYPQQSIRDVDAFNPQNEFAIAGSLAYFTYPLSHFLFSSDGTAAPDTILELTGNRLAPRDIQYKGMMEAGQQLMKTQAYYVNGTNFVFDGNLLTMLSSSPPNYPQYLALPLSGENINEAARMWEFYDTTYEDILLAGIVYSSQDQMVLVSKPVYDQDPRIFDRYDIQPGYENPILLLVSKK
jgi:hypothetical protein